MTKEETKRFIKYFDINYSSESSVLESAWINGVPNIQFSYIKTDDLVLMDNPYDDKYLYIGIGKRTLKHNKSISNKIDFKFLFTFKKSFIKYDSKWIYDFNIDTRDAF